MVVEDGFFSISSLNSFKMGNFLFFFFPPPNKCLYSKGTLIDGYAIFSLEICSFFIFWSVLYWDKENTAHKAAGIHPIKVIHNIKQTTPAKGLLIVKNTMNGKKIASNNRIFSPF